MKWSKLKSRIKEHLTPGSKKVIDFHHAIYDKYELDGRIWITHNKQEIANFCDLSSLHLYGCYYNELIDTDLVTHPKVLKQNRNPELLVEKGEFSSLDFKTSLYQYLNLPIAKLLESENPIQKAFSLIDKRTGKRTLKKVNLDNLHPLELYFFKIRVNEI